MFYFSLLMGLILLVLLVHFTSIHRLLHMRLMEKLIRSNTSKLQPASRIFAEQDYLNDTPDSFNCLADALDIKPSKWGLYHAFIQPPEGASLKSASGRALRVSIDKGFRAKGFSKATLRSLKDDPRARRLTLVIFAQGPRSNYIHIYWLDGEGHWVSKAGMNPVEVFRTDALMVNRRIKDTAAGFSTNVVGLYWVDLQTNPIKVATYNEAVKAAQQIGRPAPPF